MLAHQFVSNVFDPIGGRSTVFKVTKGSGIGMKHAGAVADLVLAEAVERQLLLKRQELGILLWIRFRDDVLAIVRDPKASKAVSQTFEALASPFCRVKLESYSLVGSTFLDFFVYKSCLTGPGHLKFRPHVKETARHLPLASDSYHAKAVHSSWPVGEMLRMARRSSDLSEAKRWQAAKVSRFQHFFLDGAVLQKCKQWQLCPVSEVARKACVTGCDPLAATEIRLVLPFRKEWCEIDNILKQLVRSFEAHVLFETGLRMKIAVSWSSAGKPLAALFRFNSRVG